MKTANKFGRALREARREARETMVTLADAAGVSVVYVSEVERGVTVPTDESVIRQWCLALGCVDRTEEFHRLANETEVT